MKPPKPKTDWIALAGHFAFGAVAGVFILFFLLARCRAKLLDWSPVKVSLCGIGAALLGGAVAGMFQQRLWVGDSYRVLPPADPEHTPTSRRLMMVAALVGLVVFLVGLFA